ncbi:MAG: hypothetical protein [Caudoviricetes sp.]|nr:MAG: hypothetical protein [Caudoviricetes sp.]
MLYSNNIFNNDYILELNSINYDNVFIYNEYFSFYDDFYLGTIKIPIGVLVNHKIKTIFDKFDMKIFTIGSCDENVINWQNHKFIDNMKCYSKINGIYHFYKYTTYNDDDEILLSKRIGKLRNSTIGNSKISGIFYVQFNNKKDLAKFKLIMK